MTDNLYIIEATEDTPLFLFDKNSHYIRIKGVSMPENAFEFYNPIEEYIIDQGINPSVIEIELTYMNSMSNKQLLKLIKQLASKNSTLKIIWKFADNDTLMKLKGEEIRSICAPIEVVVEKVS